MVVDMLLSSRDEGLGQSFYAAPGCIWVASREQPGARTSASHILAAVHVPDLAGDERRVVGDQEVDDPGHLVRPPEPADWDLGLDPLEHFLRNVLEHLRRDEPGCDRVHRDADRV